MAAFRSFIEDLTVRAPVDDLTNDITFRTHCVVQCVSLSSPEPGVLLANTVLISNLPASIDASSLEDMFMSVGNVVRARIALPGEGSVEMRSPEEARNCVLHFNGQTKDGKTLVARQDIPHVPKPPAPSKKKKKGSK